MKKTFALQVEGLHPDRRLDAIKHEIRKYLRRERSKALPEGADFWDFDCRFAVPPNAPEPVAVGSVMERVDAAAAAQAEQFYLEVLARAAKRAPRIHPTENADGTPLAAAPYVGD
ncbi:MAG: hypothetical protein KGQ30_08985 [Burkholderiales bacterium]|nr:hypothetical protein [Burkholderiales bacterium]